VLTWREAQETFLETTELGWTQKTLDKLWVAATIDNGSTKAWPCLKGSILYATVDKAASYELWDDVACFRRRYEAQCFIESMGEPYVQWWHPLNVGDETRWEHQYLDGKLPDLSGAGFTPKYKASQAVFDLKQEIARRPRTCKKRNCETCSWR
jgi:hypothetical protein